MSHAAKLQSEIFYDVSRETWVTRFNDCKIAYPYGSALGPMTIEINHAEIDSGGFVDVAGFPAKSPIFADHSSWFILDLKDGSTWGIKSITGDSRNLIDFKTSKVVKYLKERRSPLLRTILDSYGEDISDFMATVSSFQKVALEVAPDYFQTIDTTKSSKRRVDP